MRKRDFFNLSFGKYIVIDPIGSKYSLIVSQTREGDRCYRIVPLFGYMGNSIFITEYMKIDDLDEYSEYDERKYDSYGNWIVRRKILSSMISCGYFSVHSDDYHCMIYNMTLESRGSFAEFVKRTS